MGKQREVGSNMSQIRKSILPVTAGLIALLLVTAGGWGYYRYIVNRIPTEEMDDGKTYQYHYMLIADNISSPLWQAIYQSAKEAAAKGNAYLEYVGGDMVSEYNTDDYLEIAIAAKADGIIVEPNGDPEVERLINKASANNIPVVTVMEDASGTKRKSFIGVNSFQLGQEYGEIICRTMTETTRKILVLINGDIEDLSKNLTFSQIKSEIKENSPYGNQVEIEALRINSGITFESEEAIRDVFLDSQILPDILVCLDEVDTKCAYQALIDYNKVGEMDIIGYYPTESFLNAIFRGTTSAAFELDTEQVGRYSVEALQEYREMGYVSEYFSVDLELITKENVADYMEE